MILQQQMVEFFILMIYNSNDGLREKKSTKLFFISLSNWEPLSYLKVSLENILPPSLMSFAVSG